MVLQHWSHALEVDPFQSSMWSMRNMQVCGHAPGMYWGSLAWWWKRLRCEEVLLVHIELQHHHAQPLDSCLPLATMQESPAILAESSSYLSAQHMRRSAWSHCGMPCATQALQRYSQDCEQMNMSFAMAIM